MRPSGAAATTSSPAAPIPARGVGVVVTGAGAVVVVMSGAAVVVLSGAGTGVVWIATALTGDRHNDTMSTARTRMSGRDMRVSVKMGVFHHYC